jgi:superfamily II DNA or RNA helicase
MDGKDIYNYFDDNIVSNIRLKNALNNNLLVPFHYFGISDDVEYII